MLTVVNLVNIKFLQYNKKKTFENYEKCFLTRFLIPIFRVCSFPSLQLTSPKLISTIKQMKAIKLFIFCLYFTCLSIIDRRSGKHKQTRGDRIKL